MIAYILTNQNNMLDMSDDSCYEISNDTKTIYNVEGFLCYLSPLKHLSKYNDRVHLVEIDSYANDNLLPLEVLIVNQATYVKKLSDEEMIELIKTEDDVISYSKIFVKNIIQLLEKLKSDDAILKILDIYPEFKKYYANRIDTNNLNLTFEFCKKFPEYKNKLFPNVIDINFHIEWLKRFPKDLKKVKKLYENSISSMNILTAYLCSDYTEKEIYYIVFKDLKDLHSTEIISYPSIDLANKAKGENEKIARLSIVDNQIINLEEVLC